MTGVVAADDAFNERSAAHDTRPAWGAIYAMALCSFVLVASEFLPVSLLSLIARDLHLTEGQAGQAMSIAGFFAVATSLLLTAIAGRLDRRILLVALVALLVVSATIVGFAPSYLVLMIGRALIGIATGGFWSMTAVTALRLVPSRSVPAAIAIVNSGSAVASTIAAPLGSMLGGLLGWRGAFFCLVPVAMLAVVWLAATLPPMPVTAAKPGAPKLELLRRIPVLLGLLTAGFFFAGQFALYTYLRPFLEQTAHVGIATLSILLLVVGVAGFVGTLAIGRMIGQHVLLTVAGLALAMSGTAIGLSLSGRSIAAISVLLAVWGFASTAAPVAWWAWLTRVGPDDAEAGGGLLVAVVQTAITLGALAGGIVYDAAGPIVDFRMSGAILGVAAVAAACEAALAAR